MEAAILFFLPAHVEKGIATLQELRNRREWQVRDAQHATWDVAQETLQEFRDRRYPEPCEQRAAFTEALLELMFQRCDALKKARERLP